MLLQMGFVLVECFGTIHYLVQEADSPSFLCVEAFCGEKVTLAVLRTNALDNIAAYVRRYNCRG